MKTAWNDQSRLDANDELAPVFLRLTAKHGASGALDAIREWVEAGGRAEAAGVLERWVTVLHDHVVSPDELRSFLWSDHAES